MKAFELCILIPVLLCVSAPASAQYASPVLIPNVGATGTPDEQRIEIGLAVDGSGTPPYPAAFFGDYVSDGTPEGTRLIENGPVVSDVAAIPNGIGAFMVGRGKANPSKDQLYYTDGTEAGTHIISEVNSAFSEGIRKIHGFIGNSLVIETQFNRLFVTNGSVAGTFEVRPDIFGLTFVEQVSIGLTQGFAQIGEQQGSHILRFGVSSSDTRDLTTVLPHARELTAFGDHACFVAGESEVGFSTYSALNCTDGTQQGTGPITIGADGSPFGIEQSDGGLQRFGSKLYFVPVWKQDPESVEVHQSPWVTDGTQANTHFLATNSTTAVHDRIGTADGRVFFSGYFQSTGIPFSTSDGTAANTGEIVRELWGVTGLSRGDRENPTFGSAVFFISSELAEPVGHTNLRRTDGTASGTFAMPSPTSIPVADWRPSSSIKPALLGRHLLVAAENGLWSFDLETIFNGAFD